MITYAKQFGTSPTAVQFTMLWEAARAVHFLRIWGDQLKRFQKQNPNFSSCCCSPPNESSLQSLGEVRVSPRECEAQYENILQGPFCIPVVRGNQML